MLCNGYLFNFFGVIFIPYFLTTIFIFLYSISLKHNKELDKQRPETVENYGFITRFAERNFPHPFDYITKEG